MELKLNHDTVTAAWHVAAAIAKIDTKMVDFMMFGSRGLDSMFCLQELRCGSSSTVSWESACLPGQKTEFVLSVIGSTVIEVGHPDFEVFVVARIPRQIGEHAPAWVGISENRKILSGG